MIIGTGDSHTVPNSYRMDNSFLSRRFNHYQYNFDSLQVSLDTSTSASTTTCNLCLTVLYYLVHVRVYNVLDRDVNLCTVYMVIEYTVLVVQQYQLRAPSNICAYFTFKLATIPVVATSTVWPVSVALSSSSTVDS